MRTSASLQLFLAIAFSAWHAAPAAAQEPAGTSRTEAIEQEQAAKAKDLHPYVLTKGERALNKVGDILAGGSQNFHPFFDSAYSGGGFALGAGFLRHVSPYNQLDVRGSYSIAGYKLAEAEFYAPRLFKRRGELTLLGGWREATQVAFYGLGANSSKDARVNYDFQQPFASALLVVRPTRRLWTLKGGVELTEWKQRPGEGSFPSVETQYSASTLPGLGATVDYVHTQGTAAFDWRPARGYARRGGYYGVTVHDYADRDSEFGFGQVDYEAIQHLPILRETWVLSFRAVAKTTSDKGDQQIPFFMLPSLGGGSNLRGFTSWRFRDRNSLLLQAEWRIMANRFLDTAFFYDAGKVTAHTSELDLKGLRKDFGVGFRLHGPFDTPLRIEFARSNETGLAFIVATHAAF